MGCFLTLLMHISLEGLMNTTQTADAIHTNNQTPKGLATKALNEGKKPIKQPPVRYFEKGLIPANAEDAKRRLFIVLREIDDTNTLMQGIDPASEQYRRKAKFIEHSRTERNYIIDWLASKATSIALTTAHEKICETVLFLKDEKNQGLLNRREELVLDYLSVHIAE